MVFRATNEPVICADCRTTETPVWRRSDAGALLCNACGLFRKVHHCARPLKLKHRRPRRPQKTVAPAKDGVRKAKNKVVTPSRKPAASGGAARGSSSSPAIAKAAFNKFVSHFTEEEGDEDDDMEMDRTSTDDRMSEQTPVSSPDMPPQVQLPAHNTDLRVTYRDSTYAVGDAVMLDSGAGTARPALIRSFMPSISGAAEEARYFYYSWLQLPSHDADNRAHGSGAHRDAFVLGGTEERPVSLAAVRRRLDCSVQMPVGVNRYLPVAPAKVGSPRWTAASFGSVNPSNSALTGSRAPPAPTWSSSFGTDVKPRVARPSSSIKIVPATPHNNCLKTPEIQMLRNTAEERQDEALDAAATLFQFQRKWVAMT